MKLTQDWVGYLDRSYEQIKASVLRRITVNTKEITDHTESNILIIILSFFAGIGEMLNYYIDRMAREAFLGTAQRYTSIVKLTKLIDYKIKAKWYASVDLLFTLVDSTTDQPIVAPTPIYIPKNTIVTNSTGMIFRTVNDQIIPTGQYAAFSTAVQTEAVTAQLLGTTDGTKQQKVLLPFNYVHGTLRVVIDGQNYKLYESLGLMKSTTRGIVVDILEDGNAYMILGDGLNGFIPVPNKPIQAYYTITEGAGGNLPPNTITELTGSFILPNQTKLVVRNPDYSSAGSDYESIEDIRDRAPRFLRTLDRAVTYPDYIDVTLLHPGVGSAEVKYCCGKYVDVYVIPKTKGIGTLALLEDVKKYLDCRKMITTQISVKASGLSKIWLKVTLYAKPLFTDAQVRIEAINALDAAFGFDTAIINNSIGISDIISQLEQLASVDRVQLEKVRILPYARPLENTDTILNLEFLDLPVTTMNLKYTIVYKAIDNNFEIYKEALLAGRYAIGAAYNDGLVRFQINSGNYRNNERWEFNITPSYPEIFPQVGIKIIDFTAPIIDIGPLVDENTPRTIYSEINVVTNSVKSNCLPPC